MRNFLYLFTKNFLEICKFYYYSKSKIIYFRIPTEILYAYLNHDMHKTINNIIESAEKLDLDEIDKKLETDKEFIESDLYLDTVRQILKFGWLIEDLRKNNFICKQPLQLLKYKEKYLIHPGTSRIVVLSMFSRKKEIEGFYIWYPSIDPNPFILDYHCKEIKTPFGFLSKFSFLNRNLVIKSVRLNQSLDVEDKKFENLNNNSMFSFPKQCFISTNKDFNDLFISFIDGVGSLTYPNIRLNDIIKFNQEKTVCDLSGIQFKKKNKTWFMLN